MSYEKNEWTLLTIFKMVDLTKPYKAEITYILLGKRNEDLLNINISRLQERIFSHFLVIMLKLLKERAC